MSIFGRLAGAAAGFSAGSLLLEFNFVKVRYVDSSECDPYEVLGITPEIDNGTPKSHYRRLVLDKHPDKMIAPGVPPEFVSGNTNNRHRWLRA